MIVGDYMSERFLLPDLATTIMMAGAKEDAECQLFLKALNNPFTVPSR